MKILSWNIYNFFDSEYFLNNNFFDNINSSKRYVVDRLDFFSENIKKQDPDIVYLVEAGSEDMIKQLAVRVFGEDAFVFNTKPDRRGIFNACISRTPINCEEIVVENLEIPLFVLGEPGITNKFLVQKRSYIKTNLGKTNIYCVHLKAQLPSALKNKSGEDVEPKNSIEVARGHFLGELTGMAEAYALRKIFTKDIDQGHNVVMVGDFNTDTFSRRMSILRGKSRLTEYYDELDDVFPADDTSFYSYIFEKKHQRLDHVLVSKNLVGKTIDKKMLSEYINVPDKSVWHDIKILGSDHAPVVVDIDLS